MENPGALISRMFEAITNLTAFLSDPNDWGAILAVVVLLILYSVVSSIKRLNRRLESASSELSAIRSTLRKIELSLERTDAKVSPENIDAKDIRDLLFRLDKDPRE